MMHTSSRSYLVLCLLVLATLVVGMWFYGAVEGLNAVDSLYLSVMTLTTVGYGDITPATDAGKLFTSAYVVIGVGIIGLFIRAVIQGAGERISAQSQKHHLKNHEKRLHD